MKPNVTTPSAVTLSITGTQARTLRSGPDYMDISAKSDGLHGAIITIRRKPWHRRVGIFLHWHLWKRWRKIRIRM